MNKRGFSLYEVLIVIVIVSIIAGIAIFFFGRAEPVLQLNAGADMLLADLSLAKQRAISRFDNTTAWQITINAGGSNYIIDAFDEDGNVRNDLRETKVLPADIEFNYSAGDFGGGVLPNEFTISGTAVNTAASFGGNNPIIRFLPSGRAINDLNNDFNLGYIVMRTDQGNVKLFAITGMTGRIKVYTLFTDRTAFQ